MKLPVGWVACRMGEISNVIGGGTPKASDPENFNLNGYPWLTPADLSNNKKIYVYGGKRFLSNRGLKTSSAKFMPKGTVLFSSRAPIGYVAIAGREISTNQGFKSFVCYEGIIPEYVYFYLKSAKAVIESLASGTTFLEISGSRAKRIPILLSPTKEQRRIVAKLEKLLQKVDACKERLDKVPAILKRFRQSILAAACSGRLTEDWRKKSPNVEPVSELLKRIQKERKKHYEEEREKAKLEGRREPKKLTNLDEKLFAENVEEFDLLPDKWAYIPLALVSDNKPNSIVDGPFGTSVNTKTDYIKKGIPVIRINNIKPFKFDPYDIRFMSETKFNELQRHKVLPGDVLLTKVGTIGDSCIFPSTQEKAILSTTGSCRISVDSSIANAQYVCIYLNHLKPYLNSIASEAVQAFLNMKTIKNLPFALPPIDEQKEIVRRVEALFKIADQTEERYKKARAYVDKLTQSILAKAFHGELVPQDPNDEPASELVKRIQEEKDRQTKEQEKKAPK